MKKAVIFIIAIVILAGGVYLYKKQAKAPSSPAEYQSAQTQPQPTSPSDTPATSQGNAGPNYTAPQSSGGENLGSNIQVYEVDFSGQAFSPASQNVQVGDYIFFKNKSNVNFWLTSSPTSDYPWLNSGKEIPPNSEFKLQFTVAGGFVYFDKDDPKIMGMVNVN